MTTPPDDLAEALAGGRAPADRRPADVRGASGDPGRGAGRTVTGRSRLERFAPWSVAVVAVLLLVPFAGLDPARGVTFSNAPFSDEAWNLMAARNLVLFGHPSTDEWRTWLLAAPFVGIEAAAFALFGIELSVGRLVVIAIVALTGTGIAWALRDAVGTLQAWVAGIALVTSALVLYYGRLAFLEPLVGAFLVAGILSLVPAARGHAVRWGVVGGVALSLAVMTKGLAVVSAAAIVLVLGVAAIRRPWVRRWLAGAVPTAAALAAAWGIFLLWPHRRWVSSVINTIYPPTKFPADLDAALRQVSAFPFADGVLGLTLPLLVLALGGAARAVWLARHPTDGEAPTDLVTALAAGAALLSGLGVLAIVDYQPNRYVVAFLPVAAILAAWAFPARLVVGALRSRIVPIVVAVAVAVPGIILHAGWLQGAGDTVGPIQQVARAELPAGSSIAGQYAPLVALGVPVRTVVPFETVNDGDLYAAGVRYLIWIDEDPAWAGAHPEAWAARVTLGCMIWGKVPQRSCLYRLPDEVP